MTPCECGRDEVAPGYGLCMQCLLDRNPDVTEEMILLEIDDQDDEE